MSLEAFLTILLVIVTAVYVKLTHKISQASTLAALAAERSEAV
jgi:hypothetical protein